MKLKKFLSVLLALVMALAMPVTVYAQVYELYDENGEVIDTVETPELAPYEISAELTNESWVKISWSIDRWNVSSFDGYEIRRYIPKKDCFTHVAYTAKETYKVKNLKTATTYYYSVRTYLDYNGTRYYGAESKPFPVSTAPKGTKLKKVKYNGTGSLQVRFKKAKKISGYMLQYSTNSKFKAGFTNTVLVGKKKKAYTLNNLGSRTYYVRIRPYRETEGVQYLGPWSNVKSAEVKSGVSLKTMINSVKTDLSGRAAIKALTNKGVDIKKYKTTYDRIRAIYKWHAVHGLEFEHCLACNSNFNECIYYLYGGNRKYDTFIWIDAGNFKNGDGSLAIHKWSVLYFAGIPFIFDPRLQSYTKNYDGTLYFGVEKGTALQKRYKHEGWYYYWGDYYNFKYNSSIVNYHE